MGLCTVGQCPAVQCFSLSARRDLLCTLLILFWFLFVRQSQPFSLWCLYEMSLDCVSSICELSALTGIIHVDELDDGS